MDVPLPERPVLKYKRKPRKKVKRRKKLVRFQAVSTSIRMMRPEWKALKTYALRHDVSVSQLLRRIISGWLKYQKLDLGRFDIPTIGDEG